MVMIVFKSLCTFFVIYGLVRFIGELVEELFRQKSKSTDYMVVIKVKNSENTIEGTVRTLVWKFLNISSGGYIPDILIVDMGSSDNTLDIVKKLCDDYSFIYYTTAELYEKAKGK